ncbi:MAG: ribosome small subunit-dependent GTPase A [Oscillospiraceae bacterium]|nr:ribosome small subunit-dependent GTPase A [Oscillospiraceae bacterium]
MNINGIIIKGIGGFYYVEAADGIVYECKARGVFRKEKITPLAGDRVEITVESNNKNSIDKILERRNFFKRPPIANVDTLVIVSSVCDPRPNLLIIDRLTAIASYKNVEPIIVFTKDDLQSANEFVKIYTNAGFKTFAVSNETGEGIEKVKSIIDGGITVFTGNSGVGKSSLINRMYPDFCLETGEISRKLGRGRHTTRHVELFKVGSGYIADTPGFSSLDFETNDLIKKDELAFCFPDFAYYIGSCRFSTCAHVNDKGCSLVEAVKSGDVERTRHESYVTMYNEVKDFKDWQL